MLRVARPVRRDPAALQRCVGSGGRSASASPRSLPVNIIAVQQRLGGSRFRPRLPVLV